MSLDTNILKIFDNIYTTTHEWGGEDNLSGAGSTLENTVLYRQFVDDFISSNKIKSILDLGCGDFEVMRTLKNIGNVKYIGIDASKYIINKNKRLYGDFNKIFVHGTIADMNLPNYDLVIIKDVLQHLSNENIIKILDRMKTYKYIIIVNDIDNHTNEDIEDGGFRPLDLEKPPFNIKFSYKFIYQDKSHSEPDHLVGVILQDVSRRNILNRWIGVW